MKRCPAIAALTMLATVAATSLVTRTARADEIDDLEKSLDDQSQTLSTSDCASACNALASIRRAADRICALEPGVRCVAAQAKAVDATRRVRDACPQCAATAVAPQLPPPQPVTPTSKPASESVQVAGAPSRGGCASCDAGGTSPSDVGSGALALLLLGRVLSSRRARARRAPPA